MTVISSPAALVDGAAVPSAGRRVWNVTRLHFANRFSMIALPWMVLGFIYLVNIVIWISIFSATGKPLEGTQWSGSTFYFYVYFGVVAVQAMNLTFRFAMGLSATRRDYFLGTLLAFVILGAMITIVCTVLSYVEEWTHGFGMNGHMFSNVYFGSGPLWQRLFTCFGAFLFCFALGSIAGSVFVRWRVNGLYLLGAIVAVLSVAFVATATLAGSWPAVGQWFLQMRTVGVVAWSLIPTVIAGVAGYFVLRKAPSRA
ncbi:hypothetical protein GCM10027414_07610 [Humibacter ginsengiterrae]